MRQSAHRRGDKGGASVYVGQRGERGAWSWWVSPARSGMKCAIPEPQTKTAFFRRVLFYFILFWTYFPRLQDL
jgi:hypothetical protein